jgi:putative transposase
MPWTKPYHPAGNQRLDPELYQQSNLITFITIHSFQDTNPFIRPDLGRMVIDTLFEEQSRLHCRIFTYCLMPNHLHFLIQPKDEGYSVITFTGQFKSKTINQSWKLGWKGKLWQPRFYDHIVRSDENLSTIAEYISNNPVRKGLVLTPEEWPWKGEMSPLLFQSE